MRSADWEPRLPSLDRRRKNPRATAVSRYRLLALIVTALLLYCIWTPGSSVPSRDPACGCDPDAQVDLLDAYEAHVWREFE